MKSIFTIVILHSLFFFSHAQSYKSFHNNAVVIDTHNDLISKCIEDGYSIDQNLTGKTHSDLQRFKEAGIDLQFFSIWCDGKQLNPFAYANRQIDTPLPYAIHLKLQLYLPLTNY